MYVNPSEYVDVTIKSELPDPAEPESICGLPESICGLPSMLEEHGTYRKNHGQDGWTKRRRTRELKEPTGDAWLREKFGKIDRKGRGGVRRPAEAEMSNNDDDDDYDTM
uniref:Uncharacterized protein n=1 Tax=Timema bartmani TaxID=61472 RepID=A0A7R9F4U5_9NEOP|nr:unnamed protein product [Timema bartmani]